jgi:acetyl-CoA carboxylase alpha subunit
VVARNLRELAQLPKEELLARRYEKFRRVGEFAGDQR